MNELQLITTSSSRCFNRCKQEYYYSVERGIQSLGSTKSLTWGSAWHRGMEAIWTPGAPWNWTLAVEAAQPLPGEDLNAFDLAKLEVLLTGYVEYWRTDNERLANLAVEKQFRCPLVNPDTGRKSLTFELSGKLDAVCEDSSGQHIVEHKSTADDISAGAPYWEKLKIDSQCSNYFAGARSLGYYPIDIIYDVVRKPRLEPLEATPIEQRKYTKATKTEPSRLYAAQREFDETPDEYRKRLADDIAERPEFYFVRGTVVRLASEELAAAGDMWDTAQFIRSSQQHNRWPRNTDACERYHKFCQYWPVCTGSADIEDSTRYQVTGAHTELKP